MDKSPDAFRTISEVADHLETPAHVLRFWESRFPQIRPVKRAGGRRYYRPTDVALLTGIKQLLHDQGMTIRGVQKILREQGVRHVAGLSGIELVDGSEAADDGTFAAVVTALVRPAEGARSLEAGNGIGAPEELPLVETARVFTLGHPARRPAPLPKSVPKSVPEPEAEPLPEPTLASIAARLRRLPPGALLGQKAALAPLRDRLLAVQARLSTHRS